MESNLSLPAVFSCAKHVENRKLCEAVFSILRGPCNFEACRASRTGVHYIEYWAQPKWPKLHALLLMEKGNPAISPSGRIIKPYESWDIGISILHQQVQDFNLDREYSKGNPSNFSYSRNVLGNFMTPRHIIELSCNTNMFLNFHKVGVGTVDLLCGREAFQLIHPIFWGGNPHGARIA